MSVATLSTFEDNRQDGPPLTMFMLTGGLTPTVISMDTPPAQLRTDSHPRNFESNVYVYPVLSRRSGGLSLGINLNPDKVCNFDCIYCQVDRTTPSDTPGTHPARPRVDIDRLGAELDTLLVGLSPGGPLWQTPPFSSLPGNLAVVRDIAFSGDGEPTAVAEFEAAMRCVVANVETHGFLSTKIVVITNATGLSSPSVKRALALLDTHNGEVWAKLDAGTSEWFHTVDRTRFSFDRIVRQITECAQKRPIVIQTCLFCLDNTPPTDAEIAAYAEQLRTMVARGAQIRAVHLYTVARPPALSTVTPLSDTTLGHIGTLVTHATGLMVETFS